MEKTANLRLFAVHKNRLRIRRKNLCAHGEDAKKHKTVYISVNNKTDFLKRFFLSTPYGMDLAWKPSHATVPSKPNSQETAHNFEIHVLQNCHRIIFYAYIYTHEPLSLSLKTS
jgi:hypothetical protein